MEIMMKNVELENNHMNVVGEMIMIMMMIIIEENQEVVRTFQKIRNGVHLRVHPSVVVLAQD